MQIVDHKYIHGTVNWKGYVAIPELDRTKPSARQFIKLAKLDITLTKPTAFLYVDGFTMSQAEIGLNTNNMDKYSPVLKSGSMYLAHEWVYTFKNREHLVKVDIMSGTCASGIQAIYEANKLLYRETVDEVIIIGGERITVDTMRLFKELMIDVTCGDGFVYMRLTRGTQIEDPQWKFAFNRNPFQFTREQLDTLIPSYPVDYVKLHGTGTESNTEAEAGLAKLGVPLTYKPLIGHTQGVSSLLETCMVLNDPKITGKILVTANGVGGIFGSFILNK